MKKRIMSFVVSLAIVLAMMPDIYVSASAEFQPLWPLNAYRINALDHYSDGRPHNGIDIAAAGGTEVRAVAEGIVDRIYNGCTHISNENDTCGSTWGNYVLIKHTVNGKTYYSRYAHLQNNSIVVTPGESVAAGQRIGLSGSSGSSSGYHLHLELYEGSRTAAKACQSFQYYKNNPSVIDGVTFSSHIPTSSVYFGDWVLSNCIREGDVYKYTFKDTHIDVPYRCYGIAEVKSSSAYVKSMPCSRGTDPNSEDVEKPNVGDMYTILSMVKNTEGKYWYEVAHFQDSKRIGYMYAGDVTYYQTSDIVDSNVSIASEIQADKAITISGTISSAHQKIMSVNAFVTPRNSNELVARDAIETNAVTVNFANLSLGSLPVGKYVLYIDVEAKSNYSPDGNTLATARGLVYGYEQEFSVVEEVACSHSYTSKVTAPTTTSQGYTTYTCTKCGYSYKGNYTAALAQQHKITFDPNGGVLPGAYATNTLNGINVERASGFLVVYNNSGKLVDTNKYGVEVLVDANNKVIGRRDYLSETKQTVPTDGFVLSGQGNSGSWVEKIATGYYVAYDESCMEVYVYDTREAFEANHKRVPDGGAVGLLPTPTREGYTFDGWYTYREGGYKITEEDCIGSDLTFYAHWVKNGCTNGHSYYGQVKTAPTKNADGALLCTCLDCGDSFTVVLPAFNTTDYEYGIITEPTCNKTGLAVYGWLNYDYGLYTFEVVLDALGDAGHKYTYAVSKAPTVSAAGALTGTCSGCAGTTTVTLPKLNTTDYTYSVTKEPSYTAAGTGRYTWKTTTFGTFYFDVTLDKLVDSNAARIVIESVAATAGDTVAVAVYLEDNPGVAYAKFKVDYSDSLTLVSAEDQSVLSGTFTTSKTTDVKPYVLQWMGADNSTKNGCFVILTFQVAEDAEDGVYDITMTCSEAYNAAYEDVTFAITNAAVTVTSHTPRRCER